MKPRRELIKTHIPQHFSHPVRSIKQQPSADCGGVGVCHFKCKWATALTPPFSSMCHTGTACCLHGNWCIVELGDTWLSQKTQRGKLQKNYRYMFETNTDSEKGDQKFCQRIGRYVFKWSACRDSHTHKVADGIKFIIGVLQDHSLHRVLVTVHQSIQ